MPRVVRVAGPAGPPEYARVVRAEEGMPVAVSPIARGDIALAVVMERATQIAAGEPEWLVGEDDRARHLCAPLPLSQAEIDDETHAVVAAGLNYAEHADEAGGGDVFLFPKPVEPGAPYAPVSPPPGVTLFDYEVELGFVLLEDLDLDALPTREALLERVAFFVANDLTDREAIIAHKGLLGPSTGFVEAKGQPGFMPTGPWLVRGTELFGALAQCGNEGLGLRLEVDEGEGFAIRQNANTDAMILEPIELLESLASLVADSGIRSEMPVMRAGTARHYPFAIREGDTGPPRLPAGSVVLTGTPGGVVLQAPSVGGVLMRGLLALRGPIEQFRQEELARAASGEPGGYLAPGDRVRASIDGLGSQLFAIAEPGGANPPDSAATRACRTP